MKRILKHVLRLLSAVFLLWIVPTGVWSQVEKWDGTAIEAPDEWSIGDKEVIITKASELAWVAKTTNDGTETENGKTGFEGCTIKLNADIDLNSKEWLIIGNSNKFKGNFDGKGFQVKNLKIYIEGKGNQNVSAGLFGYLDGSTIQNLGIVISDDGIKVIARRDGDPTYSQVGGLTGEASSSTIQNCYVTGGSILADTEDINDGGISPYAGGLIGHINKSTSIQNCYSNVNIQTAFQYKENNAPCVGSLVGWGYASDCTLSISNCFTSGNIDDQTFNSYSISYIGGILGNARIENGSVTISNCVTQTTIYGKNTVGGSSTYINRIYGNSNANLTNCHALEGDRIIWTTDDKGTTTTPDHSSADATSKDGADWDGTSLPTNIFNNGQWDLGTLPIMPKLKDTNGKLMSNQPNIRVNPHQFTFNITGNGTVATQSGEMEASKDEEVEFVVTPLNGDNKLTSLTYTSTSVSTPTPIDKNSSNKYLFTMPDEDVVITAVFIEKRDITVVPPTNGSIAIEGGLTSAFMGNDISFTVSPDAGYELDGTPSVTEDGSGATVSCNESNGKYTFVMPAGAVSISATFKEPDPVVPDPTPDPDPDPTPVPPVYYTVSLPAVDGVITDPVAGEYSVEAWSSFRFYLTLDKEYDQSVPVVTTDRFETITPRSSDGAYIVKYVRNDVEISIDGIVKNPDPVANEELQTEGIRIYAGGGYLHIQTPKPEKVYIFTPDGRLKTMLSVTDSGERIALPKGVYFVKAGERVYKTVL
ncbi:MAG: InlB B-repeat-containing protein [Parabacteroides gordonii]|uniref:InlB B-repeat-containing protein n=1 Tax=Parabacteroides gordonii TaxID=574930 RepID=UPI003A8679D7